MVTVSSLPKQTPFFSERNSLVSLGSPKLGVTVQCLKWECPDNLDKFTPFPKSPFLFLLYLEPLWCGSQHAEPPAHKTSLLYKASTAAFPRVGYSLLPFAGVGLNRADLSLWFIG